MLKNSLADYLYQLRKSVEENAAPSTIESMCRRVVATALHNYVDGELTRESATDELVTCREILQIRESTAHCHTPGVIAPLLLLRMDRHSRRDEYNEAVAHLDALAGEIAGKLLNEPAERSRGLRRDMALCLATKALLEESKGELRKALGYSKQAAQEACVSGNTAVQRLVLHLHARIIEGGGDPPTAAAIRAFAGDFPPRPEDAEPVLDPRLWALYRENIHEDEKAA